MSIEGLTTIPSAFGPEETASRLEAALKAKGIAILARIDHAAAAGEGGAGPGSHPAPGLRQSARGHGPDAGAARRRASTFR